MPTDKDKLARDSLLNSYSHLKTKPYCTLREFVKWIENNINAVNKLITGDVGREPYAMAFDSEINIVDTKLVASVCIAGSYDEFDKEPIVFSNFNEFFPEVQFTDVISAANVCRVDINVDLSKWPNLVPALINENLFLALVHAATESDKRERALDDAKALVTYFYPQVTLDFLRVVADIGIIEKNPESFVSWLNHHVTTQPKEHFDAPSDIGNTQ